MLDDLFSFRGWPLFSPIRPVTGFVGSSFHNSIFCASPIGLGVSCRDDYSSNFHLMDKVNQPNGTIVLRHPYTRRYLCATIDGGVICDRAEIKEWEEFSLLPIQIRHIA